ncbi:MAG: hypothetical protein F6J95_033605 [Leptolyngbya sp. SIO1E4]|nr:hypothetical protein [Leptolyngbya sp. SIO1E4]
MKRMSFGNNGELVSNYIDWEAMLSQFLNWYRHEDCSDWIAEYRIKVVPNAEYYGTWYIESEIVGNHQRLTRDEALQIVHGYERQFDPATPNLDSFQFASHLMHDRWARLWPSPEYAEPTGGDLE